MAGPMDTARETASGRESRRIVRAVGVLSSATLLSRILGLARDVVTAAYFGVGGALDAFFVAFRLPNTLRRLFAEGSLTVAVVPVFVEVLETEGEQRAHRLGHKAFTLLGAVLIAVSALGSWCAPTLVRLIAWGFAQDPAKFSLTVDLTRWVFPYIGLIGLTALAGGMLNAWGVFFFPALAPVVLNACMIAAVLSLSGLVSPPVSSLVYGVLIGGFIQLALQWFPLRRKGFRYRVDLRWKDPGIAKILKLMGPTVFGVAVYQVNILVSTFLASWLPDGSVSYLYYAERLFQLPLGVFAVSMGTAVLPSFSRLAAVGDDSGFRTTLIETLRMTCFIVLPAAVGLFILAKPILVVLFQRGAFDPGAVEATAQALIWYAAALLPVAGVRVVAPAFYALKDTRTPVMAAFWTLWLNLAASLVLMWPMKHAGLALSTAISSGFNLGYLMYHLRKRVGDLPVAGARSALTRMGAATGIMAVLVLVAERWASWGSGWISSAASLLLLVAGGAVVYLSLGRILGLRDAGLVTGALARRVGLG